MSALKSKALLLIALLSASLCIVTFLVVRQQRAEGDGQVAGEVAEETLPEEVEGEGQVTGEMAGEALPEEVEEDGQVTVKIAGEASPLLFEDDSVPSALKETIATDLGRALSYLDEARFEQLKKRTRRLSRGNEPLEVTHRLVTKARPSHILPDPLQRDFGEAVGTKGGYALVVRTAVIEAYVRAAELRDQHPDMFARLDEFIGLLNDEKKMKEISRDWEACADYVYRFRSVSEEGALTIVRQYAGVRVRSPSLLDIAPMSTVIEVAEPAGAHAWKGPENSLRIPRVMNVVKVELMVTNVPDDVINDDVVCRYATDPPSRPTVPCWVRGYDATSETITVVLTNRAGGGQIRFPGETDTTITLQLPATGVWVPFDISGQVQSSSMDDAVIEAHLGRATGILCAEEDVTVIWAEITIKTWGTTPANAVQFGTDYDGTENLGAIAFTAADGGRSANGKVVPWAQLHPSGIHHVIDWGWAFKRDKIGVVFKDGVLWPAYSSATWTDDTSYSVYQNLVPDGDDRIYDRDAPDVQQWTTVVDSSEKYGNFRQWIERNGVVCSDHAYWYWRGRWKQGAAPDEITLKEVGTAASEASLPAIPEGAHYDPPPP